MDKIDIEFRFKCSQCTVGCIEQGICGGIIRRSEPFALEDSPKRLGDIQMWTVRWEEKEIRLGESLPLIADVAGLSVV